MYAVCCVHGACVCTAHAKHRNYQQGSICAAAAPSRGAKALHNIPGPPIVPPAIVQSTAHDSSHPQTIIPTGNRQAQPIRKRNRYPERGHRQPDCGGLTPKPETHITKRAGPWQANDISVPRARRPIQPRRRQLAVPKPPRGK